MCEYLPAVFKSIVVPMEGDLRMLMRNFRIQTEASLYVTDLRFKVSDDVSSAKKEAQIYGSSLSDDNISTLNNSLANIISKYTLRLVDICS